MRSSTNSTGAGICARMAGYLTAKDTLLRYSPKLAKREESHSKTKCVSTVSIWNVSI
jgi:hypothetical protein